MARAGHREAALHGLLDLGEAVLPRLGDAYLAEPDPDVRSLLVEAIWQLRSPASLGPPGRSPPGPGPRGLEGGPRRARDAGLRRSPCESWSRRGMASRSPTRRGAPTSGSGSTGRSRTSAGGSTNDGPARVESCDGRGMALREQSPRKPPRSPLMPTCPSCGGATDEATPGRDTCPQLRRDLPAPADDSIVSWIAPADSPEPRRAEDVECRSCGYSGEMVTVENRLVCPACHARPSIRRIADDTGCAPVRGRPGRGPGHRLSELPTARSRSTRPRLGNRSSAPRATAFSAADEEEGKPTLVASRSLERHVTARHRRAAGRDGPRTSRRPQDRGLRGTSVGANRYVHVKCLTLGLVDDGRARAPRRAARSRTISCSQGHVERMAWDSHRFALRAHGPRKNVGTGFAF